MTQFNGRNYFEDGIPPALQCPLTCELMHDPVMNAEGHTYERSAIERWYADRAMDPLTGLQVSDLSLKPNLLVRSLCRQYSAS